MTHSKYHYHCFTVTQYLQIVKHFCNWFSLHADVMVICISDTNCNLIVIEHMVIDLYLSGTNYFAYYFITVDNRI